MNECLSRETRAVDARTFVEPDVRIPRGREVLLVRRDLELVHLRVRVLQRAIADPARRLPEADGVVVSRGREDDGGVRHAAVVETRRTRAIDHTVRSAFPRPPRAGFGRDRDSRAESDARGGVARPRARREA